MASTEKLPSGKYRGLYVDSAGKKRRVPDTFGRKKDALDAAVDAQAKALRRAAAKSGTLSARTSWGKWWEVVKDGREFESDSGSVEDALVRAYCMPQWQEVPLNGISQRDIQRWIDKLELGTAPVDMRDPRFKRRKLSPSYVQRIYSPFRVSITKAVEDGILDASPCAGVKVPKRVKKPKQYMTKDDAAVLKLPDDYRDAVDFMQETGLRPNELIGLHVHRVDRKRRVLTVAEVFVHRARKIRGWPKDKDTREVPLTTRALEIVERRLAGRDLRQPCGVEHMRGEKCKHVLLFIRADGTPFHRDTLGNHLRRAAETADVEPLSPYSIRRGVATRVAESGIDVFTMAEIFGWADIKMAQEYVQQTATANARKLAALGEAQGLSVVEGGVGSRGTGRGTDSDNQPLPNAPIEGNQDAG